MNRNVILAIEDGQMRDVLSELLRRCSANLSAVTGRRELLIYEAMRSQYAFALLALPSFEANLEIARVLHVAAPFTRAIVLVYGACEEFTRQCIRAGALVVNRQLGSGSSLLMDLQKVINEPLPQNQDVSFDSLRTGGNIQLSELVRKRALHQLTYLSRKEKQVYNLTLRGLSKVDVSMQLNSGTVSVSRYYRTIRKKLSSAGIPEEDIPSAFRYSSNY